MFFNKRAQKEGTYALKYVGDSVINMKFDKCSVVVCSTVTNHSESVQTPSKTSGSYVVLTSESRI